MPTALHASGIVIEGTRVLIIEIHDASVWDFPGAAIEPCEDPRAAIVRAFRDLGVSVAVGDIVEATFHRRSTTRANLLLFYEAMRLEPSAPLPSTGDRKLRWANAEEIELSDFPPDDAL